MTEDFNNTNIDPYHSILLAERQRSEREAADRRLLKGAKALTQKQFPSADRFSMTKSNALATFFRNLSLDRKKENERDQRDQDIGFGIVTLSADGDEHDIIPGLDPTHNFQYN